MMKIRLILLMLLFVGFQSIANNPNRDFWTQKWMKSVQNGQEYANNYNSLIHYHNWQYKNRRILHEVAQDYLGQLEMNQVLYLDPELEDYLYQLVYQVHPNQFPKQQKIRVNVKIIKSIIPEVFSFTNGTIIISTGMLSLIHNEDELVALLTREIAHLTLDHNLKEYTAIQTKKTLSSIIGAGIYTATTLNQINKNRSFWEADYLGSVAGVGSELLSYGLLSALGVGYNKSRIYKADAIAQEWMMQNNRDPYALSKVLRRLLFFEGKHKGTNLALDEKRSFLTTRFHKIIKKNKLKQAGINTVEVDVNFDTKISQCLKANSKLLVAGEYYADAIPYLDRSINSHWALGESYLLKAIALRHMKYTKEDNMEILSLLNQAKENAVMALPWVWSEEGLIQMRLNQDEKALFAFQKFDEYYEKEQIATPLWARQMIAKLRKVTNIR